MIRKPITTPGNASGRVRTDNKTPRPRKRLRVRNMPAVVETASAAAVVANDTSTVKTSVFKYLGFLRISK